MATLIPDDLRLLRPYWVPRGQEVKHVRRRFMTSGLLFLALCFVQLPNGQMFAVAAVGVLLFLSVLSALIKRNSWSVAPLMSFLIWCAMIAYLVRPEYAVDVEAVIEASWLGMGSVVLLAASMNARGAEVPSSIVYDAAFFGATMVVISILTNSTLGGLVRPPYAGTRHVGGFDGPNEMGAFYVLGLSLMMGEHLFRNRVRHFPVKAIVFLIAAISSWSRGALAALVVMYVLSFYWVRRRSKGSARLRVTLYFMLVAAILALVFFTAVQPLLCSVRRNAGERGYLVQTVWNIFTVRPILGNGLGSYWFLSDGVNTTPHSEYLLFTVSGGLIGLALIVGIFIYWIGLAIRKRMYPEATALLVFCFLEAFFNNLVRGRVSFLFWSLVFAVLVKQPTSVDSCALSDSLPTR